jgi:diguanylate cyclase (GGDEF)-like protein
MTAPSTVMQFDPELESEYIRTRLLSSRALIRMACLLGLLIVGLRIGDFAVHGGGMLSRSAGSENVYPLVVLATSAVLCWFAWSPSFTRRYLPVANIAVPARNVFTAIAVGMLVTRGQVEMLIVLPAMVLSPFFFLGLQWRSAAISVTLTMVAFAASAIAEGMPLALLLRSSAFLLITAATSAVAAWQLERQARRSFLDSRTIAQLAEHDALTGAKNRRVFDEHLERLWHQAIDDGRPLAILLIDVDHFKSFNDRYGHQAGDVALQRVAGAVKSEISRPLDVVARYGGEEFAVLLYDMDGLQAYAVAERMRGAVSALNIEHKSSRVARVVTISIGVAAIQPLAERGPLGALQLADEALYTAKTLGRNNVHVAADSDYSDLETGVFAQYAANG